MPVLNSGVIDAFNLGLERKPEYNHHELDLVVLTNVLLLNSRQKEASDILMKAIDDGNAGLCFLNASD